MLFEFIQVLSLGSDTIPEYKYDLPDSPETNNLLNANMINNGTMITSSALNKNKSHYKNRHKWTILHYSPVKGEQLFEI